MESYARYHKVGKEQARAEILDHAPSLESNELRPARVRFVAEAFGPSVTTTVLWLRDVGLDIGCVEVSPRSLPDVGLAEWTGLGLCKALRWRVDGKTYSASGLVKRILSQYVHDVDTLAGPRY